MSEAKCRWDSTRGEYVTPDDEVCDTPKRDHCTARKTCPIHLGWGELTCARCVGRTRQDIRQIVERAALMLPEAIVAGVDSEAANLAGPAADPEAWSWRKVAAMQGRAWHLSQVEDDDDWHPHTVLVRWAHMLTEDYSSERPIVWGIGNAAKYLDVTLGKVAQDEDQDFPLLAREIRKCRAHLESVMRDSMSPERGAPCPTCAGDKTFVRLVREYAHWCTNEDCDRFHFDTDEADAWRCPRNAAHVWDLESYSRWVEERKAVAG